MKTLFIPSTTEQKLFDFVATHLLTQRTRSNSVEAYSRCLYRGPSGLKCAIGACISDENYSTEFEGYSAKQVILEHFYEGRHLIVLATHLQRIHDLDTPNNWKFSLRKIAVSRGLDPTIIDLFRDIEPEI